MPFIFHKSSTTIFTILTFTVPSYLEFISLVESLHVATKKYTMAGAAVGLGPEVLMTNY